MELIKNEAGVIPVNFRGFRRRLTINRNNLALFETMSFTQHNFIRLRILPIAVAALMLLHKQAVAQETSEKFKWPEGKGRTYRDKIANDPSFCDFAQVTGIDMDNTDFEEILPLLESARKNGQWVVLGGHEIGASGFQTTRLAMLRKLMEYALEPAHGVWIAPMGTVAKYISETRRKSKK